MPKESIIEVKNLTIKRRGMLVLDNISLAFKKREIVSIVGKNGGGKTMLLRCLVGLTDPTIGSVDVRDGLKIAYMPQSIFVPPHMPMTVESFIRLKNRKVNMSLMRDLQIDGLISNKLVDLSGGELQKVLFAATIMRLTDVVVMDEPEQNLDIASRSMMFNLVKRYSRHSSIIMVSHDIDMVFKISDRIICIDKGIHCQGKPSELNYQHILRGDEYTIAAKKDI